MKIWLFGLLVAVFANAARADEPLLPPQAWETCSPSGAYCARLDPENNTITGYEPGGPNLWSAKGWSRIAALADDGEHLVLGYAGLNLIPQNYRSDMTMLTFYRGGKVIKTVPLKDLVSDPIIRANPTVSHYYWGNFWGLNADGHFVVETADNRIVRFDLSTGDPVP